MKKIGFYLTVLFLLVSLAGCSRQQAGETDMTTGDMAAAIADSQSELPEFKYVTSEDEEFTLWLSGYYMLGAAQVKDGVICYGDGAEAREVAVLQLADEKDSKTVTVALEEYIQNRAKVFDGYAPQQAALAKGGIVVSNGKYTALLICPEPEAAKAAFLGCFGKGGGNSKTRAGAADIPDDKTEEAPDVYDAEAVLQAWRSGDDSALSETNRSILDAARAVIDTEIDDHMSDYEKELAIHDWITNWSRFDYSVFGRSASDGFTEGSDTPYGVLIDRSAMCHGYSSTFQLFMDMLDIECMTVFGTPGGNGVEHSWNMVKLDGDWYCVDAAWDDPIGGSPGHTYFNVTSEELRRGSIHRWDESAVPEATGTTYSYGNPE